MTEKRPQNCGTGYCSCIECPYEAEQAEQEPVENNDWKKASYIREALAEQAEQEPVAWHHPKCDGQCIACLIEKAVEDAYGTKGRDYMLRHINAAPVRTKDLTDDEIAQAVGSPLDEVYLADFRAVIAAYKEKNK